MAQKTTYKPLIKTVWVRRSDIIELKIWYIYELLLSERTSLKIMSFITKENERFCGKLPSSLNLLDYGNLSSKDENLPPRLMILDESSINLLPVELVTLENGFILGDSIGGIALNKGDSHNLHLEELALKTDYVLFNPGVLGRIKIANNNLIFQLSYKNLIKGEIFYKPIGGHLKYRDKKEFILIDKYEIQILKENYDVSFIIPSKNLRKFIEHFKNDIFMEEYCIFENPYISFKRELLEEIGPTSSKDGINLLSKKDIFF